ncbi:cytochrome P450 [Mycolicibacterium thermoresistibile]
MPTDLASVPEELQVDFDIFDPTLAGSVDRLQEEVAKLAAIGPVVYSRAHGGHWVVTGYDEVHEALRDTSRFSSHPNDIATRSGAKTLPLELDPPEHTAYRQALQPLFSPRRMQALEPRIRTLVNELIDGFAKRGSAEYVSEFAHELPARVFLELLNLPLEDAPFFTELTTTFVVGKPGASEEESTQARFDALHRMMEYFKGVVEEHRSRPVVETDVISRIVHSTVQLNGETRQFTDEELQNMFNLLLVAGLHTVQGSLAWAVVHLSASPEQKESLTADPSKIPAAVEEVLRIEGAVSPGRRVIADTELGGIQMKAGDQLLLSLAAANRDRDEFSDPNDVQVQRQPNRHLSFGAGPHRCLGSHLARIELRIALEELHRRIPDYRPDPNGQALWHASQVRGVLQLPIVFTPES